MSYIVPRGGNTAHIATVSLRGGSQSLSVETRCGKRIRGGYSASLREVHEIPYKVCSTCEKEVKSYGTGYQEAAPRQDHDADGLS